MALPELTMRELLEAGVHFGHQSHRWNPKMAPYLYGVRSGIHIIDLSQTVPMMFRALQVVSDTVAAGGRILFVATKRQAQDAVAQAAKNCGQFYVNRRWLGGTLTNWKTVSHSIARLKKIEEILNNPGSELALGFTKKERLNLQREYEKLDKSLGGIKNMGGTPELVFVIDTNKEKIALQEAAKLGIPVVAVIDSNSSPDGINFPIPGNDDAGRAIAFYCDVVAKAVLAGMERSQSAAGADIGASVAPPVETATA